MESAVIKSVVLHVPLRVFRLGEGGGHEVWSTEQRFRVARANKYKGKLLNSHSGAR